MDNGQLREMQVKVGDHVLLPEYGGTAVKFGGDDAELHLFRDDDILGILEGKKWNILLQKFRVNYMEYITHAPILKFHRIYFEPRFFEIYLFFFNLV